MSILMRGADSLQRGGAARALGFLGDERALDILIELAMQSRGDIQAAAIQSLGMFGSAEGVPPLIFALTNSGFTVRQDVIDALTRIGLDSVQPLMAVLRHSDPSIRSGAIEVLGKVKAVQSLDRLVGLVRDPVPEVRKAVVVALGLIADRSTIEPMLVALSDSDPSVRKEAAMMIAVFRDERTVGPLCLALWDLDLRVRWFAAYSLGVIGDVRAVQPLLRILKDPSEHVVNAASDALCRIGSIALPAIIEFEGQNPHMNKITASILARLQDYDEGTDA
jgi:HEAT repeat protein